MLSKDYCLEWLSRTVRKMGPGREFWREQGKEVSAKSVANMIGCHYSYLKYVARGDRKLSVRMHRALANAIQKIEAGEVKVAPASYAKGTIGVVPRHPVAVEHPRPRMNLKVNIGQGVKLTISPPVAPSEKMPSFKDVFKRK